MEEELVKYGLSEKEAKLYLFCLKKEEFSANELIKKISYPRATVYDILNKLSSKGFISSYLRGKTTYFKANNPEIFLKQLDEKKLETERLVKGLKKIKNSTESQVSVEILKGLSGVRAILDEIIQSSKEVIVLGNEKDARQVILHHPENFRQKRLENKIKIKNLLEESSTARALKNDALSKVKHITELRKYTDVLMIYNNVVAQIIPGEEITIIKITSKEHAKNQRILFNLMWTQAKE
jgi:sugar-specific transcriptional regulator TrmB